MPVGIVTSRFKNVEIEKQILKKYSTQKPLFWGENYHFSFFLRNILYVDFGAFVVNLRQNLESFLTLQSLLLSDRRKRMISEKKIDKQRESEQKSCIPKIISLLRSSMVKAEKHKHIRRLQNVNFTLFLKKNKWMFRV